MKNNIAIFVPNLYSNGTVKVALTQAEVLYASGQDVHLFILEKAGDFDAPKHVHIHYLYDEITQFNAKKQAHDLTILVNKIETEFGCFDLFISNSTDCDLILAKCKFTPTFYMCHCALKSELLMELKRGPIHFFRRLKKAKALIGKNIVTVSKGIAKELAEIKWLKAKSISTIYNPFDIELIRKKANEFNGLIPTEPYIIHVGRITKQKRLDILFKALSFMSTEQKLVLLTNRPERAKKLARKYGVENRIITPGFQANPYAWIKNASLMLLSSDFEGLPTVLIESLIVGTPVVSTNCPYGPSEILTNELAQYLVPMRDPKALADKAMQCLSFPPTIDKPEILEKITANGIAMQYLKLIG